MIFVTVGTHEQPFDRLIKKIDDLVEKGILLDVFVQTGYCKYVPAHCEHQSMLPYDEMQRKIEQADVVITHGGPASFVSVIEKGKVPVVVPRQEKYGEHVNDHQKEFCEELIKRGFPIIVVNDVEDLENVILNCGQGCGNNYVSNNKNFNERVLSALNKLFE